MPRLGSTFFVLVLYSIGMDRYRQLKAMFDRQLAPGVQVDRYSLVRIRIVFILMRRKSCHSDMLDHGIPSGFDFHQDNPS